MRENPLFEAVTSEEWRSSVSWPVPMGWSQYLSGMIFLRISEIQIPFFLSSGSFVSLIITNLKLVK